MIDPYSIEEVREVVFERAERSALELLGVSFKEALEQLDAGKYEGSIAAAELDMYRRMLGI